MTTRRPQPARARLVGVTLAAALTVAACAAGDGATTSGRAPAQVGPSTSAADAVTMVMHRNETCDCCGGWGDVMSHGGFDVIEVVHDDMGPVKDRFGVPATHQSCHTTLVEGYVVEGHVPAEAIADLLAQRPDIDGIALAGMPAGSPGMPGAQTEPFEVVAVSAGAISPFGEY